MNSVIVAFIIAIASEIGVPPQFALAIALEENPGLDPLAVHVNEDGSLDRGIMQLNSSWFTGDWQDTETNIRAGCALLKELHGKGLNWYQVAIAYNCGYQGLLENPPDRSIEYAARVFDRWNEMRGYKW